jgi:hypothetical protein
MKNYLLAFLSLASVSYATQQTSDEVLADPEKTDWYSLQMKNEEFKKFIQTFALIATEKVCKNYSFGKFISKHITQDLDEDTLKSLIPLIEKGLKIEWDTLIGNEETFKKFIQTFALIATEKVCKNYSFINFISQHIIQNLDEDTLKSLRTLIEKGLEIQWGTWNKAGPTHLKNHQSI